MSGSGEISVDTDAMTKYAKKQEAEIESGLVSPMKSLDPLHRTAIPAPANFPELASFLAVRQEIQTETHANILILGNGSSILATGAAEVAKIYRGTDRAAKAMVDSTDAVPSLGPGLEAGE